MQIINVVFIACTKSTLCCARKRSAKWWVNKGRRPKRDWDPTQIPNRMSQERCGTWNTHIDSRTQCVSLTPDPRPSNARGWTWWIFRALHRDHKTTNCKFSFLPTCNVGSMKKKEFKSETEPRTFKRLQKYKELPTLHSPL